jgi:hypothetical protein
MNEILRPSHPDHTSQASNPDRMADDKLPANGRDARIKSIRTILLLNVSKRIIDRRGADVERDAIRTPCRVKCDLARVVFHSQEKKKLAFETNRPGVEDSRTLDWHVFGSDDGVLGMSNHSVKELVDALG